MSDIDSNKLIIKYKIETIPGTDENFCTPVEILPSHLSLFSYELIYDRYQNTITDVKNRSFGSVKFESHQIEESVGLIYKSQVQIFTSEYSSDILNVIHIHVEDVSESVSIDVTYMQEGETEENHKQFSVDVAGMVLRYRVLVKDNKIYRLLYNMGDSVKNLDFVEYRFNLGDKIAIDNGMFDIKPFAVITKIPICMLASKDKNKINNLVADEAKSHKLSFCTNRYFERLPGYIDLNIISQDYGQTLLDKPLEVAVPVCNCKKLEAHEEQIIIDIQGQRKKEGYQKVMDTFKEIESLMSEYEHMDPKNLIMERLSEVYDILTKTEAKMNLMLDDVEISSDFMEDVKVIMKKSSNVLRRIASELRLWKMKSKA